MPDEEAIAPQHNAAGRLPWVGSGVLQGLIYTNFRQRSIAVFGTYSCKNYIQRRLHIDAAPLGISRLEYTTLVAIHFHGIEDFPLQAAGTHEKV